AARQGNQARTILRERTYTTDITARNGRNAGTVYCSPSTKKVVATMAINDTMPPTAEALAPGSLIGSRATSAAVSERRKFRYVKRMTIQMKSIPATAVPYSARNARPGA